jgi:uncharacterized protein
MRWQGGRRSGNVEDRRGMSAGAVGGGIGAVLIALVALFLGIDPGEIVREAPPPASSPAGGPPADDPAATFAATILADTEDTWHAIFRERGARYEEPILVLFENEVHSACGMAGSAVGPFYCPLDHRLYLDLGFFRELEHRFGAPGELARAYVIAHEVGHHVQTLTGTSQRVQEARRRLPAAEGNQLSVRLELQADCLAGLWAHHTHRRRDILEAGDVEAGLNAAAALGDDRLQQEGRGRVRPETFTHGTATQRAHWFRRGLESGTLEQCDTFAADAF